MAKTKSTHQPKPTAKPEPQLPDHTHIPAADVSSKKLENLKSLNSLLLKETLERRQQVEALVKAKSCLESQLNKSDDEKKALEIEMGVKREESWSVEVDKIVFGVVVAAQMGEIERFRGDEVEMLMGSVESEKEKTRRVCYERDELAVEVDRLRLQCRELVAEKCEKERVVETMTREKCVADREREELEREKSEVEKARRGHEEMVSGLVEEVGRLNEIGSSLRAEKEKLKKMVLERVESAVEAAMREREMKEEIKELVKARNEKEDSIEGLNEEVKSQKEVLDMVSEELRNKEERLKEVTKKKNEIEEAKAGRDGEVVELSRQVSEQRDVIFNLRKSFNELEEKNAMLVSEVSQYKNAVERVKHERIEAQKNLAEQKKIVEEWKLVVSEREEKVKELDQLLGKLRSESNSITEKNKSLENRLESLVKEKDRVQKSLADAQAGVQDWKAKYELAERSSKKALTMLKNTSAFLASKSEGKKELSIKEKNLGEEVQPYAAELDAIHSAFRNNEKMVEDMKCQLESVHAVAHAQKRKSLLTTLVSSASIIAAASIAYVAKGR